MEKRLNILITNDDGIHAPGLFALWEALHPYADLTIVAPSSQQSGTGMGVTLHDPLHIDEVSWQQGTAAWKVTGTPADCVRLALSVVMKQKPDLIVSGINKGANSGRNVLYSGTVGGVIEGGMRHIPGIAFSCVDFEQPDYAQTQPLIMPIIKHFIDHPLPQGTILNVNFPHTPAILGVKLARQGKGFWIEDLAERRHPEGHTYYWLGGKWHHHEEESDSDVYLLEQGYATVVPIHIGQLTDLSHLRTHKENFDRLMDRQFLSILPQ